MNEGATNILKIVSLAHCGQCDWRVEELRLNMSAGVRDEY